jgi:hypothetical protein
MQVSQQLPILQRLNEAVVQGGGSKVSLKLKLADLRGSAVLIMWFPLPIKRTSASS